PRSPSSQGFARQIVTRRSDENFAATEKSAQSLRAMLARDVDDGMVHVLHWSPPCRISFRLTGQAFAGKGTRLHLRRRRLSTPSIGGSCSRPFPARSRSVRHSALTICSRFTSRVDPCHQPTIGSTPASSCSDSSCCSSWVLPTMSRRGSGVVSLHIPGPLARASGSCWPACCCAATDSSLPCCH